MVALHSKKLTLGARGTRVRKKPVDSAADSGLMNYDGTRYDAISNVVFVSMK